MKLVRHTTSDMGNVDFLGNTQRSSHWGNKHYFLIENATPVELVAIEELMAEAGWETDGCPCYEDGFGAGFHIEISDVEGFRADYKRLKGQVAARVQRNMATEQGDALDTMAVEEVEIVARVARQVARELRSKQESLGGLRAIGTDKNIILNPYYSTLRPLSQQGWALVHTALTYGTLEDVIGWLYALELNCEASIERRPAIAKLMKCEDLTYEVAHHAIRKANNNFNDAVNLVRTVKAKANSSSTKAECLSAETGFPIKECLSELEVEEDDYFAARDRLRSYVVMAHAEALEINRETPRFSEAADLLSERIDNGNSTPLNEAETLQVAFWTKLNSVQREQAVENAHTAALAHDSIEVMASDVTLIEEQSTSSESAATEPEDILPEGELVIDTVAYVAIKQKYPLDFVVLGNHVFVGAVHTTREFDTNYYLGADQHTKREGQHVYLRVPGLSSEVILGNPCMFHEMPSETRTLLTDVTHTPVGGVKRLRDEVLGKVRS